MQPQAMRVYQITFTGRDAKGVIPMFTRVKAMTDKGPTVMTYSQSDFKTPLWGLYIICGDVKLMLTRTHRRVCSEVSGPVVKLRRG